MARRLRRFHVATGDPRATALQRESRLAEGLAWLIGRHAAGGAETTPPGREHRAVRAVREYLDEHVGVTPRQFTRAGQPA